MGFKEEMGSHFEAFQEDIKNTNQRLEEPQLWVPRPRLADLEIQEGKFGELEETATKARGRRFTSPEQQPLLPS